MLTHKDLYLLADYIKEPTPLMKEILGVKKIHYKEESFEIIKTILYCDKLELANFRFYEKVELKNGDFAITPLSGANIFFSDTETMKEKNLVVVELHDKGQE